MKSILYLLSVFVLTISWLSAEKREWTSTGGHKVRAEAIEVKNGKVSLKRENGKIVQVSLSKLVAEDREFLKKYFTTNKVVNKQREIELATNMPHPLGKTTAELKCGNYHYFLYLPKTLRAKKKYPVLFVMDPGGGKVNSANRYIRGAERNQWIIAVSKESKNRFRDSMKAVDAMIEEVAKVLPVDEKRLYTSGFSGGCRMAFFVAKKHKIRGVLACGAGSTYETPKRSLTVYGLCGTKCFNRHDMACTFKEIKEKSSFLRFFPGNHNWGNAELIDDAITHLNGVFLAKNGGRYKKQLVRYEEAVAELILSCQEKRPMRAIMWTSFMKKQNFRGENKKMISEIHYKLSEDSSNVRYLEGLTDVEKFAIKKLGSSPMAYKSVDEKVANACQNEASKYVGTPWERVIQEMGQACKQP